MKIYGFLLMIFLFDSCNQNQTPPGNKDVLIDDTLSVKTAHLRVEGMTCTGCENTIQQMVGKIEGVKKVKASYTDSLTTVVFDTSLASIVLISETINNLGYKVVEEIIEE